MQTWQDDGFNCHISASQDTDTVEEYPGIKLYSQSLKVLLSL